ncbi:MAG: SDR family oxidoreductase [Planctomycetota bacterium]|nr:SDR family oxidoreductase [Planctomycetota bacterium]
MTNGTEHNQHYTLLTGATGLLGRYLIKDLLLSGVRLTVVGRDSKREAATQRISNICSFWEKELGQELPRPVCLTGDVRFPNLGLSEDDHSWVQSNCNSCIHNAAILDFSTAPRDQEPWVTNLDGTTNVVDFCRATGMTDFHYVSTAYVCGNRMGTIREDELDCQQEFRNDYEQSKFLAEKLVRQAEGFESITVYRPAVITADSKTGYTTTYHGLHLYLRLMSLLVPQVEPDENGVRNTRIRLPMTGDEERNVVTVDWVSRAITKLFLEKNARGKTFHLSPESKLTPKFLIQSCYKYFNSTGVEFCGNQESESSESEEFETNFLSNVGIYNPYDRCDPVFDNRNTKQLAADVECPVIDEETIHRFLKFGELDRWGKRKEKSVSSSFQVTNHLPTLREYAITYRAKFVSPTQAAELFSFGFDVIGLGGGQWRYHSESDQMVQGLPLQPDAPIVRITAESLQKILAGENSENPSTSICETLFSDYVDAEFYR